MTDLQNIPVTAAAVAVFAVLFSIAAGLVLPVICLQQATDWIKGLRKGACFAKVSKVFPEIFPYIGQVVFLAVLLIVFLLVSTVPLLS